MNAIVIWTTGGGVIGAVVGCNLPRLAARLAGSTDGESSAGAASTPAKEHALSPVRQTHGGRLQTATVAAVTSGTLAAFAIRYHASPLLPAIELIAILGIAAALADLRHMRLPDTLTLPGVALSAATATGAAVLSHQPQRLIDTGIAVVATGAVLLAFALLTGGLGLGDVKAGTWMSILCAWHGIAMLILAIAGAFLLQAAVAAVLLAAGRIDRHARLPFGPALIAASLAALAF